MFQVGDLVRVRPEYSRVLYGLGATRITRIDDRGDYRLDFQPSTGIKSFLEGTLMLEPVEVPTIETYEVD